MALDLPPYNTSPGGPSATVTGDQLLDVEGAKGEITTPENYTVDDTDYNRALNGREDEYIDPATGTVAGQLDTLLDKGSPLMVRAGNMADTRSQALGGSMGGSMAAGAAQGAMIDAMLPVAQQDANTYSDMGKMDKGWDQSLGSLDKQQELRLQEMDKDFGFTKNMMETDNYWAQQIEQGGYDQSTKVSLMAGAEALSEKYLGAMAAAATSAEFSQAESDALTEQYNKSMKNYFEVANYDELNFTY